MLENCICIFYDALNWSHDLHLQISVSRSSKYGNTYTILLIFLFLAINKVFVKVTVGSTQGLRGKVKFFFFYLVLKLLPDTLSM